MKCPKCNSSKVHLGSIDNESVDRTGLPEVFNIVETWWCENCRKPVIKLENIGYYIFQLGIKKPGSWSEYESPSKWQRVTHPNPKKIGGYAVIQE